MPVDITIPSPGESITEVVLGPWHKQPGQWVEKDETLVEIESDKVTLEVPAAESGVLDVLITEGAEMNVGDVIGRIDTEAQRPEGTPATAAATNEVATATAGSYCRVSVDRSESYIVSIHREDLTAARRDPRE